MRLKKNEMRERKNTEDDCDTDIGIMHCIFWIVWVTETIIWHANREEEEEEEKKQRVIGNYANKLDLYKGCEWAKCKVHGHSRWRSRLRDFKCILPYLKWFMIYINFRGANYCIHLSWNANRWWALGLASCKQQQNNIIGYLTSLWFWHGGRLNYVFSVLRAVWKFIFEVQNFSLMNFVCKYVTVDHWITHENWFKN